MESEDEKPQPWTLKPRGADYTDQQLRVVALSMAIEASTAAGGWSDEDIVEAAKAFEIYLKGE